MNSFMNTIFKFLKLLVKPIIEDEPSLGEFIFYIYVVIFSIIGLVICYWNTIFFIALENDPDPSPAVAFYGFMLFPMTVGFVLSIPVVIYHLFRRSKSFKLSLVPFIIWLLSFLIPILIDITFEIVINPIYKL